MRLLLALLIGLFSLSVSALDLYVNNSGSPACSDSTTYANNSSSSPWCTIGRAAWGSTSRSSPNSSQAAQAGDVVLVSAGTYTTVGTGGRYAVAYNPINSGSAGNPIVFRATGTVVLRYSSGAGPMIGASELDGPGGTAARNYITWDGFTIYEVDAPGVIDTGMAMCAFVTGCRIENCTLVGDVNSTLQNNHAGIWLTGDNTDRHGSYVIRNNRISNILNNGAYHHNAACIMYYGVANSIVENNEIDNCGSGVFLKGWENRNNIIRKNILTNSGGGIVLSGLRETTRVYQNIARNNNSGIRNHVMGPGGLGGTIYIVNNTLIDHYGDEGGHLGFHWDSDGSVINGIYLQNNITYVNQSNVNVGVSAWAWDRFDVTHFDYNNYYLASRWKKDATNYTSLPAWQTALGGCPSASRDCNSITSDPLFVNAANNDFRLQSGSPARTLGRDILNLSGQGTNTVIPAGAYITGDEIIGIDSTGEDTTPPIVTSRVIPSAGTTLVMGFNEAVTFAGAVPTLTGCSGGATTLTYASGSGGTSLTFNVSRTVLGAETGCVNSYTQPGNGIEDLADNDLASFSNQAVTNNSTQVAPDTEDPTTPTNLTATAVSTSQINLSWTASTDNVGIAGYDIRRCSGSGCTPSSIVHNTTGTGTTWNNTGLSASTIYRYDVRARDAVPNYSSYSTIAQATTQAPTEDPVSLVENGSPVAVIVTDPSAPNMVGLAASLFQRYVQDMTGATLPIQSTPSGELANVYIGASSYTQGLGITSAGTSDGGFKIVTGDNYIVLLGDDSTDRRSQTISNVSWDAATAPDYFRNPSPHATQDWNTAYEIWETDGRGTMNAVHEVLYEKGFRWYYPSADGTIIPTSPNLSFPVTNRTVNPDFAFRHPYLLYKRFTHLTTGRYPGGDIEGSLDEHLNWQFSLRANNKNEKYAGLHPHGLGGITEREENKTAHPEYYAVWGGVRRNTGTGNELKQNLCSPELLSAAIRYAKKVFDLNPNHVVDLSPADGFTQASEDPAGCRDRETPERGYEGTLSDYVWDFINDVAWAIYDDPAYGPNRIIHGHAYTTYRLPPLTPSDPRGMAPNLVVQLTKWRGWTADPEQKTYYQNLTQQWRSILPSGKVYSYDYYLYNEVGRVTESMPIFYPKLIAEDLAFLNGKSDGEFIEIFTNWPDWNLTYDTFAAQALNTYVTYRLYWDADQNIDTLLNEYYDLYYGPASLKMKELHEYSENNFHALRLYPVFLQTIRTLAEEARALTSAGTAYRSRIDRLLGLINGLYLGDEVEINSCQTLDSLGTTYRLTQDVTSSGTCFPVNVSGVTLDCQGHTVTFGTSQASRYAVHIDSRVSGRGHYTTIRNCIINSTTDPEIVPDYAIYTGYADYTVLENILINTIGRGIRVVGGGTHHILRNNVVNASGHSLSVQYGGSQTPFLESFNLYENNVFISSADYAGQLYRGSEDIVRNNWFASDTTNGLRLFYYTDSLLEENTICSEATSALSNTSPNNLQWVDNVIRNNDPNCQYSQILFAPVNLTATAVSESQINLSWTASTANEDIAGYDIRRCSGSGCTPSTIVQSTTGTGTTWNNTGLSASTLYRYDVRARDAVPNYSDYSNIAEATTSASAQVTVTPSERINPNLGSIVPSSPQSVTEGQTTQFTVTPDSGYQAIVGGSCGGELVGTTYTTDIIVEDCTVIVDYISSICELQPGAGTNTTTNMATQDGIFTYRFSVIPHAENHDIVIGHTNKQWVSYADYATGVRLSSLGVIEVRNGAAYSADVVYNYQVWHQYDVRMAVNIGTQTYDVFISDNGGAETQIADDYAFRTPNDPFGTLDRVVVATGAGTTTGAYICLTGLETEDDTTPPSVTIATANPSNIITDSLTVTGSASDAVGVSGCKWRRTSAPDADNGTACTGTTSFSCETSGYAEGANTLYVGCYDAAGNYGSDSITVNLDSVIPEAPVLSALLPASGTKLARTATTTTIGVTTDIAATCRWGNRSSLPWADLTAYTSTGGTTHSSTLAVVAGGVYQICSRCYDAIAELFSLDSCTSFSVTPKPKSWLWR